MSNFGTGIAILFEMLYDFCNGSEKDEMEEGSNIEVMVFQLKHVILCDRKGVVLCSYGIFEKQ